MQRAPSRKMGEQKFHLVCQNTTTFQINVFGEGRNKGNRQQLHPGLIRRFAAFMVIAAPTGGHNVLPDIFTLLAYRRDVITRQVTRHKMNTTIHAYIRITPEMCFVI